MEKQTSWKIVLDKENKTLERAALFLSKEMGKFILRKLGVYSLYVLPIENHADTDENAVILGVVGAGGEIDRFLTEKDIPTGGHTVKVIENPKNAEGRLVLLGGANEVEVYYAAVDFIDTYLYEHAMMHGALRFTDLTFDAPLALGEKKYGPATKTRGIFTWGTPINDYRSYLENMARMKLNQMILWNDFPPVNLRSIIKEAHVYGIEVFVGYSWGWDVNGSSYLKSTGIGKDILDGIRARAISDYEEKYRDVGADGIYFQSFTETQSQDLGGICIADAVTELVNTTSAQLLEKYPSLRIQFGLHASGVIAHLDSIARVDRRVEIVWEDFGAFPSGYDVVCTEEEFDKLVATSKKLIHLRGDAPLGLVLKGFMLLDWANDRFVHQSGPFFMGEAAKELCLHDVTMRKYAWRAFSSAWLKYGVYAQRFISFVQEETGGNINLCLAGTFDGGIHFPEALCAAVMYEKADDFTDASVKVARLPYVNFD